MNIYETHINNVAATKARVLASTPEKAKEALLKYYKKVGITIDSLPFITIELFCKVEEGVVLF